MEKDKEALLPQGEEYIFGEEANISEIDSKEANDALHMLLHCALKDTEYETQKEQFEIVNSYIKKIEKREEKMLELIEKYEEIALNDRYNFRIYYKVIDDLKEIVGEE